MKNMIDYAKNYRDSFNKKPLNEIDSMIFSQLVYCHFKENNTPSRIGDIPLDENFLKAFSADTMAADELPSLLKELITSPRFKDVKWSWSVDKIDAKTEMQFDAITFEFLPRTFYIAYRGTTATTIGWKENFNMSFEDIIPAQFFARKYFRRRLNYNSGKYYLGGHSKGGNLAFFVALSANQREKDAIKRIDNFDGPGFHNQRKRYDQKIEKLTGLIHKYIPQGSIVGIIQDDLLSNSKICEIVKAKGVGPFQHNMFKWEVDADHFIRVNELESPSLINQKAIERILSSTNDQERQEFLTALYKAMNVSDNIYLKDMLKPQAAKLIADNLILKSRKDEKIWRPIMNKLIDAYVDSSKDLINMRKNQYVDSIKSIFDQFSR